VVSLKTFVKTTLTDIATAMTEFQDENADNEFSVMPALTGTGTDLNAAGLHVVQIQTGELVTVMPMDFDIAITATTEAEVSGGVGLKVVEMFRAGVDASEASIDSSISRVRFTVPVQIAAPK
jgi:hypothetical protein